MEEDARSFVVWLHGLGDSGWANEPISHRFTGPNFDRTKWVFPTAPSTPVTCNRGAVMNSWFDIHETPITSKSARDLEGVLQAVRSVHTMIDKEIDDGISPEKIFIAGLSQGGALAIASVLLYPKTLGGGIVFSGFLPFNSPIEDRISPEAKKTPILWCHGMVDTLVPFEAGQDGIKFLRKLGMDYKFQTYIDLGHSLEDMELHDFENWLRRRLKGKNANGPFCSCLFNVFS